MRRRGRYILLWMRPVWNLFKEDTRSECIIRIMGVVYEPGDGLILLRMRTLGNHFKGDTRPVFSIGIKGVVYEPGVWTALAKDWSSEETL